jgi:DNA-binding NarL/FixJ family response regulator
VELFLVRSHIEAVSYAKTYYPRCNKSTAKAQFCVFWGVVRSVTRVLLVDDDIEFLDVARILFDQKDPDMELIVSASVKDALQKLEREKFDIVISDYLMPDASGLDLLEALREGGDDIGFVIWTGHSNEEIAIKSLNLGADYYVLKGGDYRNQFSIIQNIIKSVLNKKSRAELPVIRQENASKFIHKLSHDIIGTAQNIMGYATLLEEESNPKYIEGISRLLTKLDDRVKTAVTQVDDGLLNEK